MLDLSTFAPHAPATPGAARRRHASRASPPRARRVRRAAARQARPGCAVARRSRRARSRRSTRLPQARAVGPGRRPHDRRAARPLRAPGVARNTYFVFSSDNGFHLGQHRLLAGKLTAYDPDIRVPLIVAGPGVPAGPTVDEMTENMDLCPTFAELAGAPRRPRPTAAASCRSCAGRRRRRWRDAALIEHRGNLNGRRRPRPPGRAPGQPAELRGAALADALYVEFESARFAPEYYDLTTDPDERRNLFDHAPPPTARPSSPPRSNRCTPARGGPVLSAPRTSRRATS